MLCGMLPSALRHTSQGPSSVRVTGEECELGAAVRPSPQGASLQLTARGSEWLGVVSDVCYS